MLIGEQALNKLHKKTEQKVKIQFTNLLFQSKGVKLSFKYLRWLNKYISGFRNSYLVSPILSIQMGILLSTAWFINLINGSVINNVKLYLMSEETQIGP